jgi:hypothetical protein
MNLPEKLGRIVPRERGGTPSSLRGALATKQSSFLFRGAMDCFASLAMTTMIVITREGG